MVTIHNRDRLLAAMEENQDLQPFLDNAFLDEIIAWVERLQQFDPNELDKLALIRALEVTNGCCQWGFRLQREHALSADDTRDAMQFVMGSIKRKQIIFPNSLEPPVEFDVRSQDFMTEVRNLYLDAFKNHIEGKERAFYASSVGQFLVLGRDRVSAAFDKVKEHCFSMFGPHWLEKGRKYCESYLQLADIAAIAK